METVVHITSSHSGFDDRIFFKEARSLAKRYRVIVLSRGQPGEVTTMGGKRRSEGDYDGVQHFSYSLGRNRFVNRLSGYLLRLVGLEPLYLHWIVSKRLRQLGLQTIAVVHIHEPSLFHTAIRLKKDLKARIIFDCHEYYYLYAFDKYKAPFSNISSYLTMRNFRRALKNFDAVISVNRTMKALNTALWPNGRHEVVYNASVFSKTTTMQDRGGDKISIIHEGAIKFDRGLAVMCDLFRNAWVRQNVVLKLIGVTAGAERKYLQTRKETEPWLAAAVLETGWIDYEDLAQHLEGSIGLILSETSWNALLGTPNKLFNYIAAEIPIVSFEIPELSDIIKDNGFGEVVGRRVDQIVGAIRAIQNNYGYYLANLKKHKRRYSWQYEETKLLKLYEALLTAV